MQKTANRSRKKHSLKQFSRPSLQVALILPWVLLILSMVGLVGYLSFRNSQTAIDLLANRLHSNLSDQVKQHLDEYLNTPKQVNQIDQQLIEMGMLNLKDFKQTEQLFWKQMQIFEHLSYLSYGTADGEFIGIERLDNGELVVNEVKKSTKLDQLRIYSINNQGERQELRQIKTWNPRAEAWYTETIAAQKPIWSSIFQWQDKPEVTSITSNYPIYHSDSQKQKRFRQLQGVLSIDLTLTQIHQFLKNLSINHTGRVFLTERNGLLVSSSSQYPLTQSNPRFRRIPAIESADTVIQAAAKHLSRTFPDWYLIERIQAEKFKIDGTSYFLQVTPWQDTFGLSWLIVVVTPESEFMQPIYDNTYTTILVCGLATLAAISLSICLAKWLAQPIQRLSLASQTIAAGNLNQPIVVASGTQEAIELAITFEKMRISLAQAQQELSSYAKSLEFRVEERTIELQQANVELANTVSNLRSTQNHLVQSEKLAALGQLVASVAHEINTPLGVIQSSITNILNCLREDLEKLPSTLQLLSQDQQTIFFQLLQQSMDVMPQLMYLPQERKRQYRRNLLKQLQEAQIQDAEYIADTLVELGIHENIQPLRLILQDSNARQILDAIYGLASSQQSALTITRATHSASTFVLALKSYSHRDANCQSVQINLVESLELALTVYRNLIKRGVTIVRQYPDDIPMIYGIPDEIQQVWTNLIRNAIQAMDYKGEIAISIVPQPSVVQISITDSGPGIPPEIMSRIFEPFFTTKAKGEGSGLGLSIVQKLLERSNGKIEVTSQPGQTIVQVTLPIGQTEKIA